MNTHVLNIGAVGGIRVGGIDWLIVRDPPAG